MTLAGTDDIASLVADLERLGVRLWEDGDQLRFRAPAGVLTPERLAALRASKAQLLVHLGAGRTALTPAPEQRFDPFPVTDVQAAYLLGRRSAYAYGNTGCHGYGELTYDELDIDRLTAVWAALIDRHDMLRAVVEADGSQRVLATVPAVKVAELDLRGASAAEAEAGLAAVRADMDHRVYATDRWPLFDVRVTRLDDRVVLHVSIDFLIADFISIQIILDELHRLYYRPDDELPPIDVTFRDYLRAEQQLRGEGQRARDREYWLDRLAELPPGPRLPTVERGPVDDHARFRRWAATVEPRTWAALRTRAGERGVTPSGAVLAAYAEVIAAWSRGPAFTLDVTLLNRLPLHPQINQVVGDFTGVELLAVDADAATPFGERARRVQGQLWQDLDHRLFTGVEVIREISRRDGAEAALFPVVFTSAIGLAEAGAAAGGAPAGTLGYGISQTPQVWIDCQNIERDGALSTNWDVRDGVFPPGLVDDMFAAYVDLLDRLAHDDEPWLATAPVSLPADQRERRDEANDTAAPVPAGLLHDAVVAQALGGPDRVAVVCDGRALTYGEMLGRAVSVAERLAADGVRAGEPVIVAMDRGWEQVVAVLGVLLSGGSYVPVEMSQPALRREQIVAATGARFGLTQSWLVEGGQWPAGLAVRAVDTLPPSAARAVVSPATADDLAYTIFTSGSTGTPKGVMISHRSALNTVADITARFGVTGADRVLSLSSLGFDLSVYDIFGLLAVGGALVLPTPARRADPSHWGDLVSTHGVTVWNSVPAQLQMLNDYLSAAPMVSLPSLRLALLSGDWIPVGLPDQIRHRVPGLRLISLGGATEASIWSIYHPIDEVQPGWRSIPYGRPLANQAFHVLGAGLRPVPDWVAGELYIGGVGLALGYLGDDARTAERFVVHPVTGERLYRTGDLGRYLPSGEIEFLGREDSQVKIRGYRIELAEVEAAMQAHPAVGNAAVIVDGDRALERRLVGFVEPGVRDEQPVPAAVTDALAGELAAASVRAGDVCLDGVDRAAYLDFARRLDEVALPAMLDTLRRAGLFADPAAVHTEAAVQAAAGVAARHHRLVRRWLHALVAEGRLAEAGGGYRLARPAGAHDVADAWQAVEELVPAGETELTEYFRRSIDALPALLRGEDDPLALLFPQGRLDVSQNLYENALFNRWANRAAGALVRQLADNRVSGAPLRVLEVGAGGGGTTCAVLDALAGLPVEYVCTDLSPYFLNQLRERLGERTDVTVGVYDLDRDFREYGLAPNRYDVVIAGDVLHATSDVDRVLERLRELLTPGGWVVALEMTRDHYQIMTSLELLVRLDSAVDDFTDTRRGTGRVFLSREEWTGALRRAGGEATVCLPEPGGFVSDLGMTVLAARFKAHRTPIDAADLATYLSARLPDYMVPPLVQVVDRLPLTANGKVNRAVLAGWVPRGATDQTRSGPTVASSALEDAIAGIFAHALRQPAVGRTDNLFDIGGDSLVAAQIAGRLVEEVPAAAGLHFDEVLRQLLEQPTVVGVADYLATAADAPVPPAGAEAGPATAGLILTELVGGDGTPTVLVDTATLDAAALTEVAGRLLGGPVWSVAIGSVPAADQVARVAADCARGLRAAGYQHLKIAGVGPGAVPAMEIARTVADGGAVVEELILVGPHRPAGELPALYAGDIVLHHTPGGDDPDDSEFWVDICLGDVRVVHAVES